MWVKTYLFDEIRLHESELYPLEDRLSVEYLTTIQNLQ